MVFTKTSMTVKYNESADNCPTEGYCIAGEKYTVAYDAVSNPDGTITVIGNPGPDQSSMRFAVSNDKKVAIIDGTSVEDNAQMLIVAVKLDGLSYSGQAASADYYTVGYERDELGEDSGYYRSVTNITTLNRDGSFTMTGAWNGDGTIHTFPEPVHGSYRYDSSGKLLMNGNVTGYATGDLKMAIFSNPVPTGGANDDFMSNIALRKGDRTYSTADVAGTWAITFFGDDAGEKFWSSFGIMTCNAEGACEAPLKVKHSEAGLIDETIQLPVTLAADGSYNGFFLTGDIPHYAGAIGKNGNVMILTLTPATETDTNNRRIAVAVKCTACGDHEGPTLVVATPSRKESVPTATVMVQGTATDSGGDNGVAKVSIRLNGGEEQVVDGATAAGSDMVTWSKELPLVQGKNTITVVATDLKGNATTKTIPITCTADLRGPVLKFKVPKPTISAQITLSGAASDKGGNDVAYVIVNGVIVEGATALGKASCAWSRALNLELGDNPITIAAADRLGNYAERAITVTRNPDTLPPILRVTSPVANRHYTVSPVTLSGTATDKKRGNNGIAKVTFRVNGGEEQTVEGAATGSGLLSFTAAANLAAGENTITITAYDTQANSSSKVLVVYFDAP